MSACIIVHGGLIVKAIFRPWCYILMPKCYSARLDNALGGVVKSAPRGPLFEGLDLIGNIDVVTYHIIECIASFALECSIIRVVNRLRLMMVNRHL